MTYSPMRRWGVSKDRKVGVVGLGGLGHMGVKFARAFGAHVIVFTTSNKKKEDALRLGADEIVVSRNSDEMKKHAGSFDFLLDTVSAEHDIDTYIGILRHDVIRTDGRPPAQEYRLRLNGHRAIFVISLFVATCERVREKSHRFTALFRLARRLPWFGRWGLPAGPTALMLAHLLTHTPPQERQPPLRSVPPTDRYLSRRKMWREKSESNSEL
jgi:hypothetical protein